MNTILVVDDSLITQRTLSFTLQKFGYKVLEALNGLAALELLEKKPVSLVIADLAMPKMNGLELLKKIRHDRRFQELPVIMLTASGQDEDRIAARQAGADGFLTKPHSTTELIEAIKTVLQA
jgi:CheY-like chemotaxis protein